MSSSNTFGKMFRVTTFGESHGSAMGCVVEGCPPRIPILKKDIQTFLDRRKPGHQPFATSRQEEDECEIISGVEDDLSLGSPICILIKNKDKKPKDYEPTKRLFRPSHADYTYFLKYGLTSSSGGGRASARETVARVAAGGVAEALLKNFVPQISVRAYVERIHHISMETTLENFALDKLDFEAMDDIIRCPEPKTSKRMYEHLMEVKKEGDTVGGAITCVIQNLPAGLGEPVFDKFEALLAHAMLSIPSTKSFEIGSGLSGTFLKGSAHNDRFAEKDGRVVTSTNHSGGIQGGISNGMPIYFRVGFKPISTIFKPQSTVTHDLQDVTFTPQGRHDTCVLPRATPIVEAMAWLVLADVYLLAIKGNHTR
jgi:chorismate synthase